MKKYKNGNMSMSESELNAIIANAVAQALAAQAQAQAPAKGKATKGKGKPAGSGATKPATRAEALALWADAKGITEESKAKYKALVNGNSEFYKAHWNARLTDKRYNADVKKFGKSQANKNWHKHICELASVESKK